VIGYLDTSAFVPLLVAEPGSAACRRFWDDADDVVACRLTYVETAAALAAAKRGGRLNDAQHAAALALVERLWSELDIIEVDEGVVRTAAVFADRFALRGYDAVHCASVARLEDNDLVAATGDGRLLRAWAALGIATYDPNGPH
jgi:predicted nucleic acid-binding protein